MKKIGVIVIILSIISLVFIGKENVGEEGLAVNNNVIDGVLLVNENYKLSEDYEPKYFTEPDIPFVENITNEEKLLESNVADAVELLFDEARKEGIILIGTSGYRSYESQKNVYKEQSKQNGKDYARQYVASPGASEHQTGLALDVTNQEGYFMGHTVEATWLSENAHKFGFIIRFLEGKEEITGKAYEPWHIRYVGKDIAKVIYDNYITLEEYLL